VGLVYRVRLVSCRIYLNSFIRWVLIKSSLTVLTDTVLELIKIESEAEREEVGSARSKYKSSVMKNHSNNLVPHISENGYRKYPDF
jgi:hypothetical protein